MVVYAAPRWDLSESLAAMDQELIAYLDQRFRENAQQIASLREETARQIASFREETLLRLEQAEEATRHTRVEIEGLRGEVRLLAEGIASVEEKMASFRRQVAGDVDHVRSLIQPAYSALDDRLRRLESWRERKERDPLEVIRERFGLGKGPFSS